ncbi:MAG: hypothetical protein F6J89_16650 [Symploca sp. SIO1C4]|uniref:Uncharacterized protein n=1 Tax=Symploca sp. SIO1C4 TaxID=2607765 RepID=A0A6B3N7W2_9CYAN|nr:hypothetical protein [Symploca sp. SIO1C4]
MLRWQLNELSRSLQEGYHRESPESNFAHYVFNQTSSHIPFSVANDIDIANLEPSRFNEAPIIAVVGYGLACGREFKDSFLKIWVNGLDRLSVKEAFPSDRASFFYRPTELLGIALGVSNYYNSKPEQSKWLRDIFVKGEEIRVSQDDLWTFLLRAYAANILSVEWKSRSLPIVCEMTVDELALAKWLCSVDLSCSKRFGLIQKEAEINKALLEKCIEFPITVHESDHIALLYFALKRIFEQIIQSLWDDFEQIHHNPQRSIEWLSTTFNNIHTVTRNLQSHLSKESTYQVSNAPSMKKFLLLLNSLRSDIDILEDEIGKQIKIYSSPFIGVNQGNVNIGDNVIMTQNRDKSVTNQTEINASHTNIGFINSGNGNVSNFSQSIGQNTDEITQLIASLRKMAQEFPETKREEVLMDLDGLKEDISTISNPKKQESEKRIKIRLRRLLAIAATITVVVTTAADFSNNVLELYEKLGIPIELNNSRLIQ